MLNVSFIVMMLHGLKQMDDWVFVYGVPSGIRALLWIPVITTPDGSGHGRLCHRGLAKALVDVLEPAPLHAARRRAGLRLVLCVLEASRFSVLTASPARDRNAGFRLVFDHD
jgi:hypothetical protein